VRLSRRLVFELLGSSVDLSLAPAIQFKERYASARFGAAAGPPRFGARPPGRPPSPSR
jgi:hypothetical protein